MSAVRELRYDPLAQQLLTTPLPAYASQSVPSCWSGSKAIRITEINVLSGVKKGDHAQEYETDERCHIIEVANDAGDEQMSIARARVDVGVTTAWHRLQDTSERYIIVSGTGLVEVEDMQATR